MTNEHIRGRVTKSTPLACPVEYSAGRAGFGAGKLATTSDAHALGAVTARSTRMGDQMARMLRPNRGIDRKCYSRTLTPAELAALRGEAA